jgi:N-hydroxyarylamine O-acetyltransferase
VERSDVERYLARIEVDPRSATADLDGLVTLHHAHLAHVPFENLDIVFGGGVAHDQDRALEKIVDRRRGGWCFELNGAFALLLDAVGFDVTLLGAAVLLDGPATVLDHLALEVAGGRDGLSPHLVDVGFGDSFIRPIALNRTGPQDGGNGTYELFASPEGTTLSRHVDGVPDARFRFKRVAHDFGDFAAIAASLQVDPDKNWSRKPFATRLRSSDSPYRVTLSTDRLTVGHAEEPTVRSVERDEWDDVLFEWFEIERPGPWPS